MGELERNRSSHILCMGWCVQIRYYILEGEAVSECCNMVISFSSLSVGCGRMWDNITCWPSAAVGEVVVMPCPIYFIFFSSSLGNVTRNCTSQGWADMYPATYAAACGYDTNSTPVEEVCKTTFYGTVKTGYTIGHSLSLIALTAAMIILCLFRKLHCTRNYIHMHLFMSFIMRAIAVFIKDVILFESGESDHCSPTQPSEWLDIPLVLKRHVEHNSSCCTGLPLPVANSASVLPPLLVQPPARKSIHKYPPHLHR
uniref:Vasoactive intestinal peptide receptor 1 n=1 Tax=Gopherus evgoodei TaxID=1825980 RepID=A0A8C4Y8C4_9SAUR